MTQDRLESRPRTAPLSRRDALVGTVALGLAGTLGSLRPALAQAPTRGGTMRVACPPADTIDPVKMQSGGAIAIVQQVAEYLVWVEPNLELRPVLATNWTTEDGGKTWVFDIRQGVKFQDGRDLTADDVVATFQRLVDPAVASAGAAQLGFLKPEGVRKLSSHQVEFSLDRPIGQFPYYTHLYNAVILPKDYAGDFAENPVGTGPFRMTSYRPQEGASFTRNETYWDEGKPYLDGVEISLFEGQQAMTLAMQGGQVDVLLNSTHLDAQPFVNDASIKIIAVQAAEHRQLCMRCDQKPFDDVRVRQAVALAVQRPPMVQALMGGQADIGNDHAVAPIYPEKVDLPQRAADVARAKALLTEAGYGDGFDIEFYTAQFQELPQYAQFLKQMLEPVGMRLQLKIEPLNVYYEHWTEVAFGLTDWTSRPTPEQILSSAFRSGAEWNQAHWKNEEFDKVVDELAAEPDLARRTELAQQAAAIMHEEVPAVIAYFNNNLRPVRQNVAGVEGSISQFLDLTEAHLV